MLWYSMDMKEFTIKNRFVLVDLKYSIFFEPVLDIYRNGEFFYRVPKKYKNIMIQILNEQITSDMKMEA